MGTIDYPDENTPFDLEEMEPVKPKENTGRPIGTGKFKCDTVPMRVPARLKDKITRACSTFLKYKVVCLCGSTKFKEEFEIARQAYTMAGYIVLSPEVFGHADGIKLTPKKKEELNEQHRAKISMSDLVVIINPGGYIGEDTLREIEYTKFNGIPYVYQYKNKNPNI